jgi:mRNA-degrading endonuclease RelE of RelBE toxin-antitoxin system
MSGEAAPQRIAVIWSVEARVDLRAIDREPALQILYCIDRYLANRAGDVKRLKTPRTGFRLRCGDFRVFFDQKDESASKSPESKTAKTPTGEPISWDCLCTLHRGNRVQCRRLFL